MSSLTRVLLDHPTKGKGMSLLFSLRSLFPLERLSKMCSTFYLLTYELKKDIFSMTKWRKNYVCLITWSPASKRVPGTGEVFDKYMPDEGRNGGREGGLQQHKKEQVTHLGVWRAFCCSLICWTGSPIVNRSSQDANKLPEDFSSHPFHS